MPGKRAGRLHIEIRNPMNRALILVGLLCVVALVAGVYLIAREPPMSLSTVEVEEAPSFHALIFRYDTEFSSVEQLELLIAQDAELGLRASAFPLPEEFRTRRNVLFEYSQRTGEVQLHARPMPWGLTNADTGWADWTPYQYGFLDMDQVLESYYHNLLPEISIFEFNGFNPEGVSLHSTSNRLPWSDDINYRIIGAAAAHAGLSWVSVTSQAFSVGPDRTKTDVSRFNNYDSEITNRQRGPWIRVPTGWGSTKSTLVIPTSWRDAYSEESTGLKDPREIYALMREDIDRHWKVAREEGLPLVLLIHPVYRVGVEVQSELFFNFRRDLLDEARRLGVPVMTLSEYANRVAAMQ